MGDTTQLISGDDNGDRRSPMTSQCRRGVTVVITGVMMLICCGCPCLTGQIHFGGGVVAVIDQQATSVGGRR